MLANQEMENAILDEDILSFPEAIPQVYEDLQRIAKWLLRGERVAITLQAGDLVSEAFIRLAKGQQERSFESRRDLIAAVAKTMRRVLIDHARHKKSLKVGGEREKAPFSLAEHDCVDAHEMSPAHLLAVSEALERLEIVNPLGAEIVKMRFFCGMTFDEISLYVSEPRTSVFRQWQAARKWLASEV